MFLHRDKLGNELRLHRGHRCCYGRLHNSKDPEDKDSPALAIGRDDLDRNGKDLKILKTNHQRLAEYTLAQAQTMAFLQQLLS